MDIRSGDNVKISTLTRSLRKCVFQFSNDRVSRIIPPNCRHCKTIDSKKQPEEKMILMMKIIQLKSKKICSVKRYIQQKNSKHEIHKHRKPKRSNPQYKSDESIFEISLQYARQHEQGGNNTKSSRVQFLKKRKSFKSWVSI